jgi:DNA invertase Pin-like site-specific DNA recombinase
MALGAVRPGCVKRRGAVLLQKFRVLQHQEAVESIALSPCNTYLQKCTGKVMKTFGYARVSTRDQDLSSQLDALKSAGVETIFREKISGARADRPELARLMRALAAGDTVVVTKLDRLGRSTRELLELIDRIGKTGAFFKSLGDPLWDTSSATGRLLSTLLAAIAEFERELIRERTGAGRARALARGVKFGRPSKLTAHQRAEALARIARGDSLADVAKTFNVDATTIGRLRPKPEAAAA